MPKKGVIPPQLRPFIMKKGQGGKAAAKANKSKARKKGK